MDDARAREGLEHLQAGVLELIAAARALLDVAEQLVRDPAAAAAVTSAVATVARTVVGGAAADPAGGDRGNSDGGIDGRERRPRVQRIRVS